MTPFITKDFLLQTDAARHLYHNTAATLPIIDFHCHLSPAEIAADRPFDSITSLWLGGDHYKWRALRANGIDESLITGTADPYSKFMAWAQTVPRTMRNPLYHWTHMELHSAFGIDTTLNPDTADEIYRQCNRILATDPTMTPKGLMQKFNVEAICTTDDPIDTLQHHTQIAADENFNVAVRPAWRPDRAMNFSDLNAYKVYIASLSQAANTTIDSLSTLIDALQTRHDYFHTHGCRVADHGLSAIPVDTLGFAKASEAFTRLMQGQTITPREQESLQATILQQLCKMNARAGWVQQIHYGPLRNVNTRAHRTLGLDTGYDTIGEYTAAEPLAKLLDSLDSQNLLAPTVIYNIDPSQNTLVAAMAQCFQQGPTPGKIQMGAAWWFNDNLQGMAAQIDALSTQGLLSRFIGMLTDSRSFLSYPRHDYFRRLLCNILGNDIEKGLLPASEMSRIQQMVADICYHNPKSYFKL